MDNSEKDSTSHSSEDEIRRPVVKRKKKAKATFASSSEEEDSDVEIKPRRLAKPLRCESEDENNNLNGISPTSSTSKNCADSSNDLSDNEQAEKCAICLSKFLGQDIATPETCDHVFCLECIQEWAKNVNTCPIDRLKFNLILIRHHKEEKIIKTIVVNNSALPYYSDSEESLGQADCCDICGEDKNEGSIFRCHECYKLYHYHCIAPTLPRAQSATWQCPACENYNWGTTFHRMTPSAFRVYRSLNSGIRTHSPTQSTLHSTSQEFLRLRRRVLYPRAVIQRLLSSSDSSEEDTSHTAVPSAAYQNPLISSVASKASCPLLRKRRNLCRARNRALVSATTAATETTYNSDSDDDYRLPAPESFDLVGSILESQSRLHCPDVLTLTRDGTLLQTPNNTGSSRSSNTASSTQNSEQSGRSFFNSSPPFSDNTVSPFTTNAVVRQRPLNPTHNNSSNYSEASMPTYSCSSSGAPKERTLSYDENTLARPPHGASNNDRFGNDPSSPVVQKSFCPSVPSEEMKKDGRAVKGQHSEDEVDIYSDIESVGEEDGLTSDSIEPPKGAYKCDNSPQLSNPNESSDSSDNDLVIDEDQHADEDHEKVKEPQDLNPVKNNQVCESEESNLSSDTTSDQDQLMIDTSAQNPSSPQIENSSDNCYNPGDVSPHGVFVNDESNHSKLNSERENTHKEESDSDAGQPISDVDMQDGEVSLDSAKKSYQGDVSTPCTSVKSSPKSCREETADGFEMQCENSISNENSHSAIDNASLFRHEESKEVFREASNHENENTFNSISREAEVENFENESCSNLSDETSQVEKSVNFQGEKTFSFAKDDSVSEPEECMESATSQVEEENVNNTDLIDICNDISMKSDDEDNLDSLENASTPCMDENLDGQLENSPMHVENSEEEGQASSNNSEEEKEKECSTTENTTGKAKPDEPEASFSKKGAKNRRSDNVDLGVEDISDAGSEGISAELNDEVLPSVDTTEKEFDDVERKVASLFSPDHGDDDDCIEITKDCAEFKKCPSPQTNQSFEDQEEGEIIEERPVHRCKKKKNRSQHDDTGEYGEYAPRVNISDLPRIPKLKRDKDRDSMPETISFDNKRTSVLSRVDLGEDISWKRLSKHTRERSYRDGKTRDEKLLYRERESRKKSKKSNVASRRNDSKNSERRRDDKKSETEKTKDYDSRSRKSEKSKTTEYDYSDREKRKSHKDKHSSKDKHSKDKKEKDKYDKKFSKDDKYEREKLKDESRYERDLRYDKEERFERLVYEKGKYKEKEHKSKHKDRKSESSKTCKEHSREKHKHTHSSDRFSDKQREVRKIDDKIKIVVEQKENRREKSKHKERKEIKIDKKPIIQRKVEPPQRSPSYKEITSIESKEIFAKGDSIIINVNFNRASSPKMTAAPDSDSKERKVLLEEKEPDEQLTSLDVKNKSKQIMIDKNKPSSDSSMSKRPSTPPGKSSSVLSVSESYWQSGEDPDGNNSPASDKSVEIISVEPAAEAVGPTETNIHNSPEMHSVQSGTKDSASLPEKTLTPSNEASDSASKENENFSSKRRSPRSPSPPSPADNDSYDPCEPTRSPSPPPMPSPPPLPSANPKPPPSPELPPLPPEPEPTDESHRPNPPDFISGSSASVSNNSQANTVQTQTSSASPMQSMLLPPSFLSRVSAATNNFQSMSPLAQSSRNGNFQMNNHGSVLLPPNQMQQMMGGNFLSHLHGNTALPPPPNPPNLAHMTSVPPPPPPPASMSLLSQARHPRMNVQPTLTPNSLLQSLTMVHGVNNAPMQLIHHLPPNLSGILANHQSPIVQNPPTTSLQVSNLATNQQVLRMVFSQNQMSNHGALLQSQNNCNKSQSGLIPLNSQNLLAHQKSENKHKCSPSVEKNEVIDMDVGTPYSPGDSPSVDSIGDYSPACSPEASSPKNKDVFDTLFSANQRTSEKRTYDALSSNEKPKAHSSTKKSKHEHKRHAVRMLMKDKHKKSRKDQKQADEAQLKILDELPSSAVEMQVKEKFLKKLNRQERVVEEVKMVLKPFYKSRDVTKEEYKDILRKAVPKICHNRSGEINPVKVKSLVESYVKKAKHSKKKGDKRKSKFS